MFIREFIKFIIARKNYWILPVILPLLFFAGLIILTEGTALAPFIYTIF